MKTDLLMDTRRNSSRQDITSCNVEFHRRPLSTKSWLRVHALPLTTGSLPLSMPSSSWIAWEHASTFRPLPAGPLLPLDLHCCFLTPGLSASASSVDSGLSLLPAERQPSSKRKRRYVSSSSQSSESAKAYAGAKFTSPPSPKLLPLPPLHWRVDFGISSQSSDSKRYCTEMTSAIKSLLRI